MKKILIAGIILGLLLLPSISYARWQSTLSGAIVTLAYDEPITNADDSNLTDLAGVELYYDIGDGWVDCEESPVPATALTGGGYVTSPCTIPVLPGMERDVNFKANACDLSQNCSLDSDIIVERIDRLAPSRIQ